MIASLQDFQKVGEGEWAAVDAQTLQLLARRASRSINR